MDCVPHIGTQVPTGSCRHASAGIALEPGDELVEPKLLESLADRVELAGAVLDELASLFDEVERLPQTSIAGIEPAVISSTRATADSYVRSVTVAARMSRRGLGACHRGSAG